MLPIIHILAINLFNPTQVSGWLAIGLLALILGMVHGITPDEHTWPITFSYAIGSYSTRKGLKNGLIFSLFLTIQRALASELAYLGFARFFNYNDVNYIIYLVVGSLMAAAGIAILKKRSVFHFDLPFFKAHQNSDHYPDEQLNDLKPWMPAIHGFVAGWGFGAFAIIIYTVLSPATHSVWWAWVPGALFGIGTLIVQVLAGGLFGLMASRKKLPEQAIRSIALHTAANTLSFGGLAFVMAGLFGLVFPNIANLSFKTGLKVHNLSSIGLSFFLVIFVVMVIGIGSLIIQTKQQLKLAKQP